MSSAGRAEPDGAAMGYLGKAMSALFIEIRPSYQGSCLGDVKELSANPFMIFCGKMSTFH